ncbi:NAD(P)/FAD-dependent oxidoreductase [Halorhodospira halochloris]|uniref:NAD(P)/FAD-dependent oxidoreductase n=1 Tax=Halorhodospira halochloris TaxID=1052 RepID=UPI001EE80D07|nr:NAD(P)/FAD-dependent oxidoreductase [Halorhodospira halochloris]MCG5530440.1 NAD(P)/FAD-dependent oxidoreductase [Halorhodospira halochloris]
MLAIHPHYYDIIIIGAGAAGLMCAGVAGQQGGGHRILVLDHANKPGKKILMSGGGRCNFTNLHCTAEDFICANPHFAKSALSRFTPWDFIALVERYGIQYHERDHGQLFCDRSAKDILNMLLAECERANVEIRTRTPIKDVRVGPPHQVDTPTGTVQADALVIATGGYSIPSIGASGFGFDLAQSLDIPVRSTRPGLVPLTLGKKALKRLEGLSGIALDATANVNGKSFRENLLFTHRGLSGPAVLQVSSYWEPGQAVEIDLFPDVNLGDHIRSVRQQRPKMELKTLLGERLTRRVAQRWCDLGVKSQPLGQLSDTDIDQVEQACQSWQVWPSGTEGYRVAEVTVGGVDTDALSSKTLECRAFPGLYFIGEVVDVTGHLGGFNFQWAWASGHAAGWALATGASAPGYP